jgi:hypothetical protein
MPSNDEKARRKELLHSLRDKERQKARESFPASILALKGLFDFLDLRLSESECDDTLRFTLEYIRRNDLDKRLTVEWVEGHGGFCDCEVLNNLEPVVAEAVTGLRPNPQRNWQRELMLRTGQLRCTIFGY